MSSVKGTGPTWRVKPLPGKLAMLISSGKAFGQGCLLLLHGKLDLMLSEVRARGSGRNKMDAGVI